MSDRPLVSYDPNPLLAWLYHRFFESIEVDESWAKAVRAAGIDRLLAKAVLAGLT